MQSTWYHKLFGLEPYEEVRISLAGGSNRLDAATFLFELILTHACSLVLVTNSSCVSRGRARLTTKCSLFLFDSISFWHGSSSLTKCKKSQEIPLLAQACKEV